MDTAVVMAGGRGTRLRPITARIPKAMVPIDHRPIMEFVVAALRASGFSRVLAILQLMPGTIVRHFGGGEEFGIAIDYLLQKGEVDTAGSVRQALWLVKEDDFAVASSDILFHADLRAGAEMHLDRRGLATLALTRAADPAGLGTVERDPGGRVLDFREKPRGTTGPGALVNAGLYFLNRRAFDRVEPERSVDFGRDLFPALVRAREPVFGWDLPGYWRDVGTPESLQAARRDARDLPAFRDLASRDLATGGPSGGESDRARIWVPADPPASPAEAPGPQWIEMSALAWLEREG